MHAKPERKLCHHWLTKMNISALWRVIFFYWVRDTASDEISHCCFHTSNLSCNTFPPIYPVRSSREEHHGYLGTVVLKCHLEKEHWLQDWNKQEATTETKQLKDHEVEQEHSGENSPRLRLLLSSAVLLVNFSLMIPWLALQMEHYYGCKVNMLWKTKPLQTFE